MSGSKRGLGIPTASMFGQIVTPGGKLSASRGPYMGKLLAEWALGEPVDAFENDWMERGSSWSRSVQLLRIRDREQA